MHQLLAEAVEEARALWAGRGGRLPDAATLAEAGRLLDLAAQHWPGPDDVRADADGAVTLEWDVADRGWVELRIDGSGQLAHSAVIDGDDYGQTEPWAASADAATLPDWAAEVLRRLLASRH